MNTFPNLIYLVKVNEQDILMHWIGLGYYSWAKRIYESSKILLKMIGKDKILDSSCWPIELDKWMSLPGIGRSTAGSIISSSFDL